ncbi:MAG TPA: type II toxin-antitoxin system HicB family antitoxin [Frankiaceae bacterium]|nr:type II toxin-antitoxin system HicB family antitoxin [Frankiaceae bacterium]
MEQHHFSAVLTWDEADGWWVAECPDLPGCMSQGRTEDEALANLADAIAETLHVLLSQRERWTATGSSPGEVRLAVAI